MWKKNWWMTHEHAILHGQNSARFRMLIMLSKNIHLCHCRLVAINLLHVTICFISLRAMVELINLVTQPRWAYTFGTVCTHTPHVNTAATSTPSKDTEKAYHKRKPCFWNQWRMQCILVDSSPSCGNPCRLCSWWDRRDVGATAPEPEP